MEGNRYMNSTPPVREGEEIDVTIEAVGEKGDGIARKEGFVLFVPGTRAGESVRIRVTRVLPKVGFAEKIGAATGKPAPKQEREKPAEPEFDPQPELDSEDFGEEGSGDDDDENSEESDDDSEDDVADSKDEKQ